MLSESLACITTISEKHIRDSLLSDDVVHILVDGLTMLHCCDSSQVRHPVCHVSLMLPAEVSQILLSQCFSINDSFFNSLRFKFLFQCTSQLVQFVFMTIVTGIMVEITGSHVDVLGHLTTNSLDTSYSHVDDSWIDASLFSCRSKQNFQFDSFANHQRHTGSISRK